MSRPRQSFADHLETFLREAPEQEVVDAYRHFQSAIYWRFPTVDLEPGLKRKPAKASDLVKAIRHHAEIFRECERDATGTPTEAFFRELADNCEALLVKAEGRTKPPKDAA